MTESSITLSELPQLRSLFESLNSGRHLNRHHDHALWVELEQHESQYQALFSALGYDLRVDGRGFAWFHTAEATSTVSRNSRRLALFFLLLFEHQADQGLHLGKFHHWTLDRTLLDTLWEKNKSLLETEELFDADALTDVLRTGERYGIVACEQQRWRLLPAAYRYLDHFEELAAALRDQEAADAALAQWEDEP
jgi:hypothetical protein